VLAGAEGSAKSARTVLNDAMNSRAHAQAAHAQLLHEKEFAALDRELKDAARALEKGNQKVGYEKNADLAARYSALEVRALKANVSEPAEEAYKQAVKAHAKHLAPVTLKTAKNELSIARNIIENEKENYHKAQFHA